jgi:hypothetical protein
VVRRGILLLVLVSAGPWALGQGLPAGGPGTIDFAAWADEWETQLDVLSVLPPAERQVQFVDTMRTWRDRFMTMSVGFQGLSREEAQELRGLLREQAEEQIGRERMLELSERFREEAEFQRVAFASLDDAGRDALIRRFYLPAGQEDRLGLDDERWQELGDLISRIRTHQREMSQALAGHRQTLVALAEDGAAATKTVLQELTTMREARTQFQTELTTLRNQLRPLVTPEEEAVLVVEGILD